MILIADGGSTKTHWSLINKDLSTADFYSEGYNPYFVNEDYIAASLKKAIIASVIPASIEKIYFYGAGVHNKEKAQILENAFKQIFQNAEVFVEHDLLAACRGLLGSKAGFAAILGTGTNTCLYDGTDISYHIDSAAYILGDEGSGCYIGKKFLTAYLRNTLPQDIKLDFEQKYSFRTDDILDRVYTQPLANRFCASFCDFIASHLNNAQMLKIVQTAFDDFFTQLVCLYPDYQKYELNTVGSVGFYFKDILKAAAGKYGMKAGNIIKSPIEGLIAYHKELLLSNSETAS